MQYQFEKNELDTFIHGLPCLNMKLYIAALLMVGAVAATAQEEINLAKKSEIKVNALYLILGGFELDYEYLINEESSIGISATVFFDKDVTYNWGITPHYRLFFWKSTCTRLFCRGTCVRI